MWNWDSEHTRKCFHADCGYEVKHSSEDAGYCSRPNFAHWNEAVSKFKDHACECGSRKTREISPGSSYLHAYYCPAYKPF